MYTPSDRVGLAKSNGKDLFHRHDVNSKKLKGAKNKKIKSNKAKKYVLAPLSF